MMCFFEFFFSGPGWGWKAAMLIVLLSVFFKGIREWFMLWIAWKKIKDVDLDDIRDVIDVIDQEPNKID